MPIKYLCDHCHISIEYPVYEFGVVFNGSQATHQQYFHWWCLAEYMSKVFPPRKEENQ